MKKGKIKNKKFCKGRSEKQSWRNIRKKKRKKERKSKKILRRERFGLETLPVQDLTNWLESIALACYNGLCNPSTPLPVICPMAFSSPVTPSEGPGDRNRHFGRTSTAKVHGRLEITCGLRLF
ncbi:hypothetical protein CEXT_56891 [Caerostris extrusa]|uniref:Uncharacterized protein n=1 Tax=Caerostris extrusa TaxID=172846 RepID=A0AAV4Q179_CAEEX|nr:hypothetical protein CEXT_56891 [Caerostris extrusa]